MKDEIYLGVIVLLIFAVVVSLTSEDAETSALQDKIKGMKGLEKENDDLEQKINKSENNLQDARTQLAMKTAAAFKRKQYTVNYDKDYNYSHQQLDNVYKVFDAYATRQYIKKMTFTAIVPSINILSLETKSNLSIKKLTFEVGEMEIGTEVSLDYDMVIAFEPINSDCKERTATNLGQLRVIKTESGWKVNEDMEQMNSTNEVLSEVLLQ